MTPSTWRAVFLSLTLTACASNRPAAAVYIHPNADFSIYTQVAVLPLENLSSERFAAERVRELLVVELSALEYFQVVETGEVNRVIRAQNLSATNELGPEAIQSLGKALGAQALLTGSVIEFREQRTGTLNTPEIALSLKLLDVETGLVVWSVTDARTGLSLWTRMFGVGQEDPTTAARKLIRQLFQTMG